MIRYTNAVQIKQEIDSYEKHFTGAPLLIGIDAASEYATLLGLLKDDYGKKIVCMSDFCNVEFPPNPTFQISAVSDSAKEKPVIWIGAAQASMLYGQQTTEKFFVNVLGCSFSGPVTLLCPFCCNILENIGRKYIKLGDYITILSANEQNVPSIYVSKEESGISKGDTAKGIKELLTILENGNFHETINLITSCKYSYLEESMYPIYEGGMSSYKTLCKREPIIAANVEERNGTSKQWDKLLSEHIKVGTLSLMCNNSICPVDRLANDFCNYLSSGADTQFLCFICLKVFCGKGKDYLAYCLKKTSVVSELERAIYTAILDVAPDDSNFSVWRHQRRRMIAALEENSALMKDFCERATIKGKDILLYISDDTEEERAALIHALCCYSYSLDELEKMLNVSSPRLSAYLRPFYFDEYNTKVMDSDGYVRSLLSNYFQRYKIQKLTNRQDADFVELVEEEAKKRSFTKLQARSAIIKKIDKQNAQPYFFDALGVEFLSFIQETANKYGMQFECFIGRCNLPSITSKNKEFYNAFPEGSIKKEEGLDELKHQGTKYDFQFTPEPLHIFDELSLLDRDLKKMSSALSGGTIQKIIIISDHGASRLAVTYQSENDKIELKEPGQHSGRCCPVDEDPNIPFVTYEDGFAVLANYERFKGSRKADVETHGGASLEETVVPVITLTLKPKEQQVFFVDDVVVCSSKDGTVIRLFANPPLKKPRMEIGDQSYNGRFDGDKHNVVFELPEIKRKGHHEAVIYDAGRKVAELAFETRRQTGTNQLI